MVTLVFDMYACMRDVIHHFDYMSWPNDNNRGELYVKRNRKLKLKNMHIIYTQVCMLHKYTITNIFNSAPTATN